MSSADQSQLDRTVYEQFIDLLMPELTPYATAAYLHLLRNAIIENGSYEIRIGKRALAERFARGARGERVNYKHITSIVAELEEKGCLQVRETAREGTLYLIVLPIDVPLVQEKIAGGQPRTQADDDYFTSPERRAELFARDEWTCAYCGDKLTPENATLDHFIPQHQGGANTKDNLRTACFLCNSIKSGKTYEEAAPFILKSVRDRRVRTETL